MILAVDIGNSNIVIGAVRGDEILFQSRLVTEASRTADEYGADLENLLGENGFIGSEVEGAIISGVVPSVTQAIKTAVKNLWSLDALVVGQGVKTGLTIDIDNPAETGPDLIVGCVAALREHKPPLIVIDMGTATTIIAMNRNGTFLGGCIAPGVKISMDALTGRTALLPEMELKMPPKAIGRNTVDCMRSGIVMGSACMLDGMVQRMEEELGEKATVVATGGVAGLVVPMCRTPMIYDRDLLLKGLIYLYRENTQD